jgi:hypothetical protein
MASPRSETPVTRVHTAIKRGIIIAMIRGGDKREDADKNAHLTGCNEKLLREPGLL